MPVQTDHLADEIKDLTASVIGLRTEFAGFKGSVETELQLTRTLGKFVAGFLVAIVASAFGLTWQAGALNAEVKLNAIQLEKRMDKLEAKVDQRFGQIEQQLGQIVQRLDQVVAKTKPN
jgi:predicted  nucleic acid-binding Zn-ribbon protein